jgi:gliding motility-associated lipoprotein GldH
MEKNKNQEPCGNARHWIFLATLTMLLAACGPRHLFEETIAIPGGQWNYADTLAFPFAISDTSERYDMYLDFEYADTFSHQNIYVKLHTVFPNGERLAKQKSFELFDDQGNPFGKRSGKKIHLRIVLQEQTLFSQPGAYTVALEQYTRDNPLGGIYAVGLAIMGAQQ